MATTVPNTFVNGTNADAPQVNANFTALTTAIDGVATAVGVPTPAVKQRGAVAIGAAETRALTSFGTLTTPDQITGIVLPTNGLIAIGYQATWQNTAAGAGRASIFIGANQVKINSGTGSPALIELQPTSAALNTDFGMSTFTGGLVSTDPGPYTGDVTTGQVLGTVAASPFAAGPCYIFAAAGTYTVSIQFRATSGTVTVKNRKLWCWVIGF